MLLCSYVTLVLLVSPSSGMTTTSSGTSRSTLELRACDSLLTRSGHLTYYFTTGMCGASAYTPQCCGRALNSLAPVLLSSSAHDKFDASFKTNVLVNSSGFCEYLPPGKFLFISILSLKTKLRLQSFCTHTAVLMLWQINLAI